MAKLVSKTYGDALFELALEENVLDTLFQEVQVISEVLRTNDELMKLLNHPKIVKEEKIKIIENVFKERVSSHLTGFLKIVVTKDRYNQIPEIFAYFLDRVKEYKHIGVAYVTSAVELNEIQKQEIVEKLLKTTSYKTFEMHYQVDDKLIGGMIIRIGDRIVDSSIRTKINEMSKNLMRIQL